MICLLACLHCDMLFSFSENRSTAYLPGGNIFTPCLHCLPRVACCGLCQASEHVQSAKKRREKRGHENHLMGRGPYLHIHARSHCISLFILCLPCPQQSHPTDTLYRFRNIRKPRSRWTLASASPHARSFRKLINERYRSIM